MSERLSKKLQSYVKAYKEPPYGREVEGTVELLEEVSEKLAEYEDLEEQGLLLRLPCTIGTKVYYIQQCLAPSCKECLGFTLVDNCYTQYKARIFEQKFDYWHLEAFGKCVFLTKSEAEEKLRELEGK